MGSSVNIIMATREKTIVYGFPTRTANTSNAVAFDMTQITVTIPESSPTFTSVYLEVGFMDLITATGGTITEHRCSLRLGDAGYTTITETDNIAHSGENLGGVLGPFDFTSHFTTNWTGTSMTCDVQLYFDQSTGTTLGMNNITVMLYVTYTYDDNTATNPTQAKTVRIPLESLTTVLSTTANSNFGTSQIPNLTGVGGMLPESSVDIKSYFFVIEGNTNVANNATDMIVTTNVDSGTSNAFGLIENALASDRFIRLIHWFNPASPPSTGTTHNFQLWCNVASRFNHACVDLVVTYTFDAFTTTRVVNSLQIPIEISSPLGVTTTAEASRFKRDIFVMEPGTITLHQSAYRLNWNISATPTVINTRAGGQSYRDYTSNASVACGMYSLQQRIDSGGSQGAGITLARGNNSITIDAYATNVNNQATNLMGYITLNYSSDVGSGGIGQHNHTVYKTLINWDAFLSDRVRVNNYSFSIPEANYWIVSSGFLFIQWVATASQAVTFDVECLGSEGKGGGYYDIYADAYQADAERACSLVWMRGRDVFKRFPNDNVGERLDIETARDYRLFTTTTSSNGMVVVVTYHSFSWTVSGSITNSNGVDDIVLNLIRVADNEIVQTQTVAHSATSYSFTVYNNAEQYYVTAHQDSTHKSVSQKGTPA